MNVILYLVLKCTHTHTLYKPLVSGPGAGAAPQDPDDEQAGLQAPGLQAAGPGGGGGQGGGGTAPTHRNPPERGGTARGQGKGKSSDSA